MTTIYLIRHAEALGNVERRFQGHFDGKISENGKKQLKYLQKRFKKVHLDAVYSSPLSRAVDTADTVNHYSELPVILDYGLMEICGGAFEGMKYDDIPERFPEQWEQWTEEPSEFVAPGGESMRMVFERMKYTMDKIVHGNMGHVVAVVSHGCALRNYLCYLLDKPFELLDSVPWGDNTCVSRIDFDDRFRPTVRYVNDVSHLPEDLSTLAKQNWWRKNGQKDEDLEDNVLHIESGELFLEDNEIAIEAADILTPQGAVPLNMAQIRVYDGWCRLKNNKIKLIPEPEDAEKVILHDEGEDFQEEVFEGAQSIQDMEEQEALTPEEAGQGEAAVTEVPPEAQEAVPEQEATSA